MCDVRGSNRFQVKLFITQDHLMQQKEILTNTFSPERLL